MASALLDGIRPLAFVGGQALWIAQPALGVFMNPDKVADFATLLERPEAIDLLRTRLEECTL